MALIGEKPAGVVIHLRLLLPADERLRQNFYRRGDLETSLTRILETVDLDAVEPLRVEAGMEVAPTTVKLPKTLHRGLKVIARRRETSVNALINGAIMAHSET